MRAGLGEVQRIIREEEPPRPSRRLSTLGEALTSVANRRGVPPARLGRLVAGELDWIVMKAMEKDRRRRYESAGAMADDLRRHLGGEPIAAAPPGAAYRAMKLARHHRGPLVAASAFLALLVAATVASSLLAVRARRAESTVASQLETVRAQKAVAQKEKAVADQERIHAQQATTWAAAANASLTRQLSDSYVDHGIAEWDQRRPAVAALWFVKALELDKGDAEREALDRMRIGTSLFVSPRPLDVPVPPQQARDHNVYVGVHEFGSDSVETGSGRRARRDGNRVQFLDPENAQAPTPSIDHGAEVQDFGFCADNHVIWTFGKDKKLRLWDANTRAAIATLPLGEDDGVFSRDDSLLLSRSKTTNRVRAWDVRTGKTVIEPVTNYCEIYLTHDGKSIALADENGLRLRDIRSGVETKRAAVSVSSRTRIIFSGDDSSALVFEYGGSPGFCIWRPTAGRAPIKVKGVSASGGAFSPDGKVVAVVTDRGAQVWDVEDGQAVTPLLPCTYPNYESAAFSSDGRHLLLIGHDSIHINVVHVWDASTGRAESPVFGTFNYFASFTPDGSTVIVTDQDSHRVVWDIWSHESSYTGMAPDGWWQTYPLEYSADGRTLLTAGGPGIRFLDPATGYAVAPPILNNFLASYCMSKDGKELAAVIGPGANYSKKSALRAVQVIDLATMRPISPQMPLPEAGLLHFSADGKRLLGVAEKSARVWEAPTWKLLADLPVSMLNEATCWNLSGALSPDGRFAAILEQGGAIRVWDLGTNSLVASLHRSEGEFEHIEFASDGRALEAMNMSGGAEAWAISNWSSMATAKLGVYGYRSHRAGKRMIAWDKGGVLRLRDSETGRDLTPALTMEGIDLYASAFSPDGRWVAAGSEFGTARVYDAASGRPVTPLFDQGAKVVAVCFSPDSKSLAVADDGGGTSIYPLAGNSMPIEDLRALAELLASAHIDATGSLMIMNDEEWQDRWKTVRARVPEFFKPFVDPPDTEVSPRYRQVVAAWVAAARSDTDRLKLARELDELSSTEAGNDLPGATRLLAETALSLDPQRVKAADNLAWADVLCERYEEALALCRKYAGRRIGDGPDRGAFGAGIPDAIKRMRMIGKDDPTLAAIEAVIGPTTRPAATLPAATEPAASQPATQPATPPAAPR